MIDKATPALFGAEESHGYLTGGFARDKDAAVAAPLLSELAAMLNTEEKTPHEKPDDLYWRHGCHIEGAFYLVLPGAAGLDTMRKRMARFRASPPTELGGFNVRAVRDYLILPPIAPGGQPATVRIAGRHGRL